MNGGWSKTMQACGGTPQQLILANWQPTTEQNYWRAFILFFFIFSFFIVQFCFFLMTNFAEPFSAK
jgi:hypothetical protein